MRLTIFGATGGIGRHLVDQAVAAGHDVTAVVRDPAKLTQRVRTVTADLAAADPGTLVPALAGADAVLSGLGPRSKVDAGITSRATAAIIAAMWATAVRRVIVVSAAPIGTVASHAQPNPPRHDPGDGLIMRHLLSRGLKMALRQHYADLARMEDLLRASDLEWTVSRPPRLTNRPVTGTYRTALDRNIRGGLAIPRADVAHHLLHIINEEYTFGHTIGIAT